MTEVLWRRGPLVAAGVEVDRAGRDPAFPTTAKKLTAVRFTDGYFAGLTLVVPTSQLSTSERTVASLADELARQGVQGRETVDPATAASRTLGIEPGRPRPLPGGGELAITFQLPNASAGRVGRPYVRGHVQVRLPSTVGHAAVLNVALPHGADTAADDDAIVSRVGLWRHTAAFEQLACLPRLLARNSALIDAYNAAGERTAAALSASAPWASPRFSGTPTATLHVRPSSRRSFGSPSGKPADLALRLTWPLPITAGDRDLRDVRRAVAAKVGLPVKYVRPLPDQHSLQVDVGGAGPSLGRLAKVAGRATGDRGLLAFAAARPEVDRTEAASAPADALRDSLG